MRNLIASLSAQHSYKFLALIFAFNVQDFSVSSLSFLRNKEETYHGVW